MILRIWYFVTLWCFQNVVAELALQGSVEGDSVFARINRKGTTDRPKIRLQMDENRGFRNPQTSKGKLTVKQYKF